MQCLHENQGNFRCQRQHREITQKIVKDAGKALSTHGNNVQLERQTVEDAKGKAILRWCVDQDSEWRLLKKVRKREKMRSWERFSVRNKTYGNRTFK